MRSTVNDVLSGSKCIIILCTCIVKLFCGLAGLAHHLTCFKCFVFDGCLPPLSHLSTLLLSSGLQLLKLLQIITKKSHKTDVERVCLCNITPSSGYQRYFQAFCNLKHLHTMGWKVKERKSSGLVVELDCTSLI